jgi:Na+/H+-dicarboxylate symporter/ABC-type amino acid transport substrate-binding protein
MLVAGALVGLLLPAHVGLLRPLATIFLQTSQVVVMPFLICELIGGFGRLSPGSLGKFATRGGVILLCLWLAAALLVTLLPLFLPHLVTSEFYHVGLFDTTQPRDLLTTYLPDNIFGALAADNFPAVVLFSCVVGILLQASPERGALLQPLAVITDVFKRMNKLVVRLAPYGIFAMMAMNAARFNPQEIIRIQGLFALCLISFVVLSLGCILSILCLTPLSPSALWLMTKGPLALTASSANLLIALPMLVANLQEQLPTGLGGAANDSALADLGEELAPLVSLGFSLPTLGQVATLIFIPFSAWYVDRRLDIPTTIHMLLSAIPATVSGIKAVMRQELLDLGLPLDLLQLVYVNGEWLYRFEKVLGFEGLVVLSILAYAIGAGVCRVKPLPLLASLAAVIGLTLGLGWTSQVSLAVALKDSYRNDLRLLALTSTRAGDPPLERTVAWPAGPLSLQAIKQRGVLRAGVKSDALPWAFRNSAGNLVGFDIDLLKSLSRNLGVRLEIREATLAVLESELDQGRLDLVAGGIQNTPMRAIRHELSRSYQTLNLGLVVPDEKVLTLQQAHQGQVSKPLVIAVQDESLISYGLEAQLAKNLGGPESRAHVTLVPLLSAKAFFSPAGQQRFDGLLVPAEAGAGLSVLNPRTSLITPFGRHLNTELVLLLGGHDSGLRRYLNGWLTQEIALGRIQELFDYWILLKSAAQVR